MAWKIYKLPNMGSNKYKKPLKNKKLDHFIGWSYTFFIALMVKTLTYTESLGAAMSYYGAMFGLNGNPFTSNNLLYLLNEYKIFLIIAAIGAFPLLKVIKDKIMNSNKTWLKVTATVVASVALIIILLVSLSFMHRNGFTSFMYQQF